MSPVFPSHVIFYKYFLLQTRWKNHSNRSVGSLTTFAFIIYFGIVLNYTRLGVFLGFSFKHFSFTFKYSYSLGHSIVYFNLIDLCIRMVSVDKCKMCIRPKRKIYNHRCRFYCVFERIVWVYSLLNIHYSVHLYWVLRKGWADYRFLDVVDNFETKI